MNKGEKETFNKKERLCSTKLIEEIFENGSVFYTSLFRVSWIACGTTIPFPAQAAISVPKRTFRLAVTRNLIKRRIREAYRRNKKVLYDCLDANNTRIAFVIYFKQNKVPDYSLTEKSVREVIESLCRVIAAEG